jgi:hypothetical protein
VRCDERKIFFFDDLMIIHAFGLSGLFRTPDDAHRIGSAALKAGRSGCPTSTLSMSFAARFDRLCFRRPLDLNRFRHSIRTARQLASIRSLRSILRRLRD